MAETVASVEALPPGRLGPAGYVMKEGCGPMEACKAPIAGAEDEGSSSRCKNVDSDRGGGDSPVKDHSLTDQVKRIVCEAEPIMLNVTVNRISKEVKIVSIEALEIVVRTIFDLITNDTVDDQDCSKHARCGETFADIMFSLRMVAPTFDIEGDKPMTFTRVLLNATQDTFEEMCTKFSNAKQAELESKESQNAANSLIALVSFIGHLYVRRLVAARVMAQVVHDLIGVRDRQPVAPLVRCVCELMQVIGKSIDANKQGSMLCTQFLGRLNNLAAAKKTGSPTQEACYSQEIRDAVKAVNDARFEKWPARAGTQVLVQYHIIDAAEASKIWFELKRMKQLPVDQMELEGPKGMEEDEDGKHLRVSGVISGSNLAVVFSKDSTGKLFKDHISALTSIHAGRLMVFDPKGALLEDSNHLAGCDQMA